MLFWASRNRNESSNHPTHPKKSCKTTCKTKKKPPVILCCFFSSKVSTKGPRNLANLGGLKVEGGEMIVMAAKLNFTNCSSLSHGGGFHSDLPLKQEMGQIHFRFLGPWKVFHLFWGGKSQDRHQNGTPGLKLRRLQAHSQLSTSKMVFLNKNWLMFVFVVVFSWPSLDVFFCTGSLWELNPNQQEHDSRTWRFFKTLWLA